MSKISHHWSRGISSLFLLAAVMVALCALLRDFSTTHQQLLDSSSSSYIPEQLKNFLSTAAATQEHNDYFISQILSVFSALFSSPVRIGIVVALLLHMSFSARFLGESCRSDFRRTMFGIIHGASLMYLLLLVFLLVQNSESDVRELMEFLIGGEGKRISVDAAADHLGPSGSDAIGDLNFCMMHNMDKTINIYILAHLAGYMAIGFLTRNALLSHFLSLSFEIVEVAMQHWLHDFRECWWDHLVVDVLICNSIGIHFGLFLADVTGFKRFHWVRGEENEETSIIWNIIDIFNPFAWIKKNWAVFASVRNLIAATTVCTYATLVQLQSFMLKETWGINSAHPFMIARVIVLFLLGTGAATVYYEDVVHRKKPQQQKARVSKQPQQQQQPQGKGKSKGKKQQQQQQQVKEQQVQEQQDEEQQQQQQVSVDNTNRGMSLWLAYAITILEILNNIKYAIPIILMRSDPTPGHIWIPMFAVTVLTLVWFVFHFVLLGRVSNKHWFKWIISGALLTTIIACYVVLFLAGTPDIRTWRDEMDILGKEVIEKISAAVATAAATTTTITPEQIVV